ncbi:hypothetical protein GEMRC1_013761 [Eukaryota sp. GEM-RC1]
MDDHILYFDEPNFKRVGEIVDACTSNNVFDHYYFLSLLNREGHVFKDLREKVDAFRIKFLAENDTISIRKDQSSISFRFSSATSDTPRAAIIVSLTGSSTDPYHDFPSYVLNHRHFVSPKGFATHHSNDCIDVFDQDSSSDPEMSFSYRTNPKREFFPDPDTSSGMIPTLNRFMSSLSDIKKNSNSRIAFVVSGSGTGKTAALASLFKDYSGFYLNFGSGTPGLTPTCSALQIKIRQMCSSYRENEYLKSVQTTFVKLLLAHVQIRDEWTNDSKSNYNWFVFSTSPIGQLKIVQRFLDLCLETQSPTFGDFQLSSTIIVLDELSSVMTWRTFQDDSSVLFRSIRAVACPTGFLCTFIADTCSTVFSHLPSPEGKSRPASLDHLNTSTVYQYFFIFKSILPKTNWVLDTLKTAIQRKFATILPHVLDKAVGFLELVFRGWFLPVGLFIARLKTAKTPLQDSENYLSVIYTILNDIEEIAREKLFPQSIDSSESDLEVAALGIASSVMGVNYRDARLESSLLFPVLESAQSGFIEWNPTNPIIFKVELQRSLLSAYAISSAIGKIGESLQQRLFTKLSSIIVNPSFRLYLDRKIRPFLNECFSVFHFILPSVSVCPSVSAFLLKNCVEDVLPSISTDILSSGVESFIRPSRTYAHTVEVQNFPVVSSITCVSHCFALRFGNFSLTTDDKIHLSEIDDYDYYPNRESISLNHLGVAVMPNSDTSRFDLFIPSVISTKFIPVEVRTRKDLDYPGLIDKYFSLGNDSVFVFKNGNFPFAIIFHFHERDFQPPPIDQQRPSTTMRSMLQCNVKSMLTVPYELAYPAVVDSGTHSVPISSHIDLDYVDSSPTSSVEEPDTLPTSRAQNKCGICKTPGHTRRNCSLKEKKAKRPRR